MLTVLGTDGTLGKHFLLLCKRKREKKKEKNIALFLPGTPVWGVGVLGSSLTIGPNGLHVGFCSLLVNGC